MGKVYNEDRIGEFPIEIYLDIQKTLKVVIEQNENNKYSYKIFINGLKENSSMIENLEKFTAGQYSEKDGAIVGELIKNKFKSQLLEMKIKNFKSIQVDTKENTILYPIVPSLMRTIMAQTDNPKMPEIIDTDWENDPTTDLHCHYTAMLEPEKLIALGLKHNINYPISHIYALGLELSDNQKEIIESEIIKYSGEDILSQLNENFGNWEKIKEIFKSEENKNIAKMSIPLKSLLIGKSTIKEKNFNKLIESCSLPKEAQGSFSDMKETYTKRSPFTNGKEKQLNNEDYQKIINSKNISASVKNIFYKMCLDRYNPNFKSNNLQEDMMLWIARNAKEMGIDYIEMSHNALATVKNEESIQSYNKVLDSIEKETGTKLRFLVGISRSTKEEKANQMLEYTKESLKSKYIVGIDFLGEESNSTESFEKMLSNLTEYALENDPDMVIRVHAGETASYDANVLKTLEIVYGKYLEKLRENKEQEDKTNIEKPNLRIGHGIYGIKQELENIDPNSNIGQLISNLAEFGIFDLNAMPINEMNLLNFMAQMDTVVIERCLTSNVLLSNKNDLTHDPMQTYIDYGIKCVLGTDGYGVYGTTSRDELIIATTVGIDSYYIEEILKAERYVKERSLKREEHIKNAKINDTKGINETTRNDNTRNNIEDLAIAKFPEDKRVPIIIAGGSYNKFDIDGKYVQSELKEQDEDILNNLVDTLDSEKYFFVIGGKMQGQEKRLIELINQKGNKSFDIIMVTKKANEISEESQDEIRESNIKILESEEKEEFESYKKIDRDIFSQDREAVLLIFDGYQEAEYLVADANNGKNNHIIYARENINELLSGQRDNIKNKKTIQDITSIGKEILRDQENTKGKDQMDLMMKSREKVLEQQKENYQGVEI